MRSPAAAGTAASRTSTSRSGRRTTAATGTARRSRSPARSPSIGYDFPNLGHRQPIPQHERDVHEHPDRRRDDSETVTNLSPAHASTVGTSQTSLSWSPATDATSYQVILDPDTPAQQFSPWLTGTSWTTPALANGAHKWKVQARNSAGVSAWSSLWTFYVSTGFVNAELDNGARIGTGKYRVYGTREGLVGGTTSSGHVIVQNDHFVSLPACVATTCNWLTPGTTDPKYGYVTDCGGKCYVIVENPANNTCRVEPVYDRGPWFNVDDYWNPTSSRFVNKQIASENLGYQLAQGYSAAAAARDGYDVGWGKTNGIGMTNTGKVTGQGNSIDIADGTWLELGFPWNPGPQVVVVTMLWQVSTSVGRPPKQPAKGRNHLIQSRPSQCRPTPAHPALRSRSTGTGYGKNETIRVYLDSSKTAAIATTTSDSAGAFKTSFTVPSAIGGPHRIHVVGRTSGLRTAKTFKIAPLRPEQGIRFGQPDHYPEWHQLRRR